MKFKRVRLLVVTGAMIASMSFAGAAMASPMGHSAAPVKAKSNCTQCAQYYTTHNNHWWHSKAPNHNSHGYTAPSSTQTQQYAGYSHNSGQNHNGGGHH